MLSSSNLSTKLLVITPAFNEEANIASVVREVRDKLAPAAHLVVDDCSTDGTAGAARAAGALVASLPVNLGIGGAVQTGFIYALEYGFDCAVQVDGDGQHDPADALALIRRLEKRDADVVIGSRFLEGGGGYANRARKTGISLLSRTVSSVSGVLVTDATSGLRAYNRGAMKYLSGNYTMNYPEPDSIINLASAGFKIVEVPVGIRDRKSGSSSITVPLGVSYVAKVLICSMAHAFRR